MKNKMANPFGMTDEQMRKASALMSAYPHLGTLAVEAALLYGEDAETWLKSQERKEEIRWQKKNQ